MTKKVNKKSPHYDMSNDFSGKIQHITKYVKSGVSYRTYEKNHMDSQVELPLVSKLFWLLFSVPRLLLGWMVRVCCQVLLCAWCDRLVRLLSVS
jgi:hypothetical protein